MALQIPFFMAPDDEREVLRRLASLELELWPELTDPNHRPPLCNADTPLVERAYYLAAGDVVGAAVVEPPSSRPVASLGAAERTAASLRPAAAGAWRCRACRLRSRAF